MVLIFRPHITFYPPDMTSTASVATTRRLARNNSGGGAVHSSATARRPASGARGVLPLLLLRLLLLLWKQAPPLDTGSFGDPGVVISFGPGRLCWGGLIGGAGGEL